MLASKIGLMGGGGTRSVIISSNQSKYNLRTAMGNPSGPQRIIVTINSGVEITSDNAAVPAFDEGTGWASGTVITIVNAGKIYGMGGAGGSSATFNYPGGPSWTVVAGANGGAGGTALALRVPTTIDNGAGEIFGGGGGGGGAQGLYLVSTELYAATGGGGGGGRGAGTSAGGTRGSSNMPDVFPDQIKLGSNGNTGSSAGAGSAGSGGVFSGGSDFAGTGGAGGDWGTAGSSGGAATNVSFYSVAAATNGGAGGNAVALNGNSVTWLAGNTGARVKGAVS